LPSGFWVGSGAATVSVVVICVLLS